MEVCFSICISSTAGILFWEPHPYFMLKSDGLEGSWALSLSSFLTLADHLSCFVPQFFHL